MRNLKRLATSLVALVLVIAFSSCEKSPAGDALQDVSFNVNNVTNMLKKSIAPNDTVIPVCKDLEASYVIATINGDEYRLDILDGLNDGTETQVIKLMAGTYSLESFLVYAADDGDPATDELLWAAPMVGSYYANLWGIQGVAFDFDVTAFTKTKVDVDVLCWEDYDYDLFGFNWFDFQKVTIKTMCFFGDICTPNYEAWGETQMDFVAKFNIVIMDGNNVIANQSAYGENAPLCVEYPDFGDRTDDIYEVQVSGILPNEDLYYLVTLTLDANTGILSYGSQDISTYDTNGDMDTDGIIDAVFYEGDNCNYSGNAGVNYVGMFPTQP